MSWIKILAINFLMTFALIGIMFFIPPVYYSVVNIFKKSTSKQLLVKKLDLNIYSNYYWAQKHFIELSELTTQYFDYITWRRTDYSGYTININNGLRDTLTPKYVNQKVGKFWFFGGSTTWGTGVSDNLTYPSIFAKQNNVEVLNFGETGYNARQSLALFANQLVTGETDDLTNVKVIFYDGVNDVAFRCRVETNGLGSMRESLIRDLHVKPKATKYSFSRTFSQLSDFLVSVSQKVNTNIANTVASNAYDCVKNKKRALEVAQTLVNTWKTASNLAQSMGGEFFAILQPVAYFGKSEVDYLNLNSPYDKVLSEQYKVLYPLIIKIAEQSNLNFIDLSKTFDGCQNCYIDYCHVGPQGHYKLVQSLSDRLIN